MVDTMGLGDMMELEKLKQLAKRPGYRIVVGTYRDYPDNCQTHYLVSHKNRVVGAVCVCDDGTEIVPAAHYECQYWFTSEQRDTRIKLKLI